jgi:hypothetical protein
MLGLESFLHYSERQGLLPPVNPDRRICLFSVAFGDSNRSTERVTNHLVYLPDYGRSLDCSNNFSVNLDFGLAYLHQLQEIARKFESYLVLWIGEGIVSSPFLEYRIL